jgi:hypothetical protein
MRRFTPVIVAVTAAAAGILATATPAAAAPALAAPTCQTLQTSTSFQARCKSWNPLATYRAWAWCTDSDNDPYVMRLGNVKSVGGIPNTYGAWSAANCPAGLTIDYGGVWTY